MAKISTYPNVGTPTLSDMLIGTEVTDNNATKNFAISDILGLIGSLGLYVPYTGATANVDLGSFGLDVFDINFSGTFYAVPGSLAYFDAPVTIVGELRDGVTNSPGTAGQLLSSNGTTVEWIDPSAFSLNLQQVLDDGNTANQNITLTGLANQFSQSGNNAGITQSGTSSYISQTGASAFILQLGATAFISQGGANAYISQVGLNSYIEQTGTNSYILQSGISADIRQTGANAKIQQTGSNSIIEQTGDNTLITQVGANAIIEQVGNNAFITQAGDNAFIEQLGANASIQQTGANPYIEQAGTTGYIKPAQIQDSTTSVGTSGEILTSLGSGLGVKWEDIRQFGSFYDSTLQTAAINTATPMKFGANDLTGFGVSVTADGLGNKTQIQVTDSGVYNVQFSAQVVNAAGATTIYIWFQLNGSGIADSNTVITLPSNNSSVASWNYFINLTPGDILQIMWYQNNAAQLASFGAASPRPGIPSTILTVNRIR
jgi:hypothetical protein